MHWYFRAEVGKFLSVKAYITTVLWKPPQTLPKQMGIKRCVPIECYYQLSRPDLTCQHYFVHLCLKKQLGLYPPVIRLICMFLIIEYIVVQNYQVVV